MIRFTILLSLIVLGCSDTKQQQRNLNAEKVNSILGQIQENDPVYTEKGIDFDSIVTLAGSRVLDGALEKVKVKMFFFGEHCRGYYNLSEKDNKNLQFFGKRNADMWSLKCVTKLNMEEVGGYIMFWPEGENLEGVWSTGHVNFKQGKISLKKQDLDYNILTSW